MKIILTKAELVHILSAHFNATVSDVELRGALPGATLLNRIRNTVETLNYTGHEKIAAIRALRDLSKSDPDFPCTIALADAKWAIENFRSFCNFIQHNYRLPHPDYQDGLN